MPALGDCEELSLQHWPATECKTEQVWSAKAEQISQLKNQMQLEPGGVFFLHLCLIFFASFFLSHLCAFLQGCSTCENREQV